MEGVHGHQDQEVKSTARDQERCGGNSQGIEGIQRNGAMMESDLPYTATMEPFPEGATLASLTASLRSARKVSTIETVRRYMEDIKSIGERIMDLSINEGYNLDSNAPYKRYGRHWGQKSRSDASHVWPYHHLLPTHRLEDV